MDLFAQLQRTSSTTASSVTAPAPTVALVADKIITVAIEKVKNRTITAIYELDYSLDKTVKSPEELLSKLKKKICNSNGFIRKPESESAKKDKKKKKASSDDEDSDSEDEESDDSGSQPAISGGTQYVIQGNHSNAICRYIYSLGVNNIIRTGTA